MEMLIGGLIGLAIGLVLVAIFVVIFRWLWNITMPEVFGLKTITFWQALRILILANILFGGGRVIERSAVGGHEAVTEPPPQNQSSN